MNFDLLICAETQIYYETFRHFECYIFLQFLNTKRGETITENLIWGKGRGSMYCI